MLSSESERLKDYLIEWRLMLEGVKFPFSLNDDRPAVDENRKKTLALDLDETLMHCKKYLVEDSIPISCRMGSEIIQLFIIKRPGLDEFLETMSKHYTLILYTSALKQYAKAVLEGLQIKHYFSRIYHREHCNRIQSRKYVKQLTITGVPLSDIILIDDCSIHVANQPDNILLIKPFTGNDSSDNELTNLTDFLLSLAEEPDVRPVLESFLQKKGVFRTLERGIDPKFMPRLRFYPHKTRGKLEQCSLPTLNDEEFFKYLPSTNPSKLSNTSLKILQKTESAPEKFSKIESLSDAASSDDVETPRRVFNPNPITGFKAQFNASL